MTHDIGHYRFQLANGAALSFKAAAAVLINEAVILAVIIPYRAGAVFQNIFFQKSFPVFSCGSLCKIYEHPFAAPPGSDSRLIAFTGLDEHIFFFHLFQFRMDQKHSRFHIGGYTYPSFLHLGKKVLGVFKTLFIPGKCAALDPFFRVNGTVS